VALLITVAVASNLGNQTPYGVYNLLRFGAERGGREGVSPFALSDIESWAAQSRVVTPAQIGNGPSGRDV
jgi:hypothetical protein